MTASKRFELHDLPDGLPPHDVSEFPTLSQLASVSSLGVSDLGTIDALPKLSVAYVDATARRVTSAAVTTVGAAAVVDDPATVGTDETAAAVPQVFTVVYANVVPNDADKFYATVNGTQYVVEFDTSVHTNLAGVLTALTALVDANAVVSAALATRTLTITGASDGTPFAASVSVTGGI